MTTCVYYRGQLATDKLVVSGPVKYADLFIKTGMIFKDRYTNVKSTNKDELENPVEYAMYGFAGTLRNLSRFLRWFISRDHPHIEHQSHQEVPDDDITDDFEIIVIFKDKDIIRLYDNQYNKDLFTDFSKEETIALGSGSNLARTLLVYDPEASWEKIFKAVSTVDLQTGSQFEVLSFTKEGA